MHILDYNSVRRGSMARRIWRMGIRISTWLVMVAAVLSICFIAPVVGYPELTIGLGSLLVLQTDTEKMVAIVVCAGLVVGGLAVDLSWARRRRGKGVAENPGAQQVPLGKKWRLRRGYRVGVMVAGGLIALVLLWVDGRGWRQMSAIEALRASGGTIYVSSGFKPGRLQMAFGDVQYVNLDSSASADTLLKLVPRFGSLHALHLAGSSVTDRGMEYVGSLHALQLLDLQSTAVTDAGLTHLKEMHDLHSLNLERTVLTDAGLVNLTGLKNLAVLHLEFTHVTDAGLGQIGTMQNLQQLALNGTAVTDAGLPALRSLARLRILDVHDTKITPAGREALRGLLPGVYIYYAP